MPKVSVIVPVYKVEKYITACAESIMCQTHDDIEVIFVDDCSPDNSIEILSELLARSEYTQLPINYSIIRNKTNQGVHQSRLNGLHRATGEYILFVDSDDYLEPTMVQELHDGAIMNNSDCAYCDMYIVSDAGSKTIQLYDCEENPEAQMKHLLHFRNGGGSLWNKLFNKSLFHNLLSPQGHMFEDWVIAFQLLHKSQNLHYVKKPLYNYRIVESSAMHRTDVNSHIKAHTDAYCNAALITKYIKDNNLMTSLHHDIIIMQYAVKNYRINEIKTSQPAIAARQYLSTFPALIHSMIRDSELGLRCKISAIAKEINYKLMAVLTRV